MSLTIIGTSHISKDSIDDIKKALDELKPEIVAIELDAPRAAALLSNQKRTISLADAGKIGLKGFVFAKIGQLVQRKLGEIVGISPGSEMKAALQIAKKKKLKIALIDQPITKTLRNFSTSLTWKEKFRFLQDIVASIIFRKRKIKEYGLDQLDLKKVPPDELIETMMKPFQARFPTVYKTLVTDRNSYMVRQLVKLMRAHQGKTIIAIVGAGHKKGMEELLLKVDVI